MILLSKLSDSYVATPKANSYLMTFQTNVWLVSTCRWDSLNKTIGECNQVCLLPFVSIHATTLNLSGDFEQINWIAWSENFCHVFRCAVEAFAVWLNSKNKSGARKTIKFQQQVSYCLRPDELALLLTRLLKLPFFQSPFISILILDKKVRNVTLSCQ